MILGAPGVVWTADVGCVSVDPGCQCGVGISEAVNLHSAHPSLCAATSLIVMSAIRHTFMFIRGSYLKNTAHVPRCSFKSSEKYKYYCCHYLCHCKPSQRHHHHYYYCQINRSCFCRYKANYITCNPSIQSGRVVTSSLCCANHCIEANCWLVSFEERYSCSLFCNVSLS